MIHAFFLSLGQLLDGRVAAVFLKSIAVTLLLFASAGVGLWYAMHWLMTSSPALLEGMANVPVLGWFAAGLAALIRSAPEGGTVADVLAVVLFLLASWLLFRVIAIAVIGVFADEVVMAVEARHYPDAHAAARDVPLGRSVLMGLGSAWRTIAVNLLLSPLYLMLLVTGVGTAVVFFVVNSWLLGRDLGEMVAARHMPKRDLRAWRKRTRFRRLALGAVGTGMFLVPVLNLLAPVLGAAMAAHLFHIGKRAA